MGCCVCRMGELNKFENLVVVNQERLGSKEFVEVSLDSQPDEQDIEVWRKYKNCRQNSFTESLAAFSTFAQTERKTSVYSKGGSIVDSFSVSLYNNACK